MRGAARILDPTVHGGPLTTGASDVLVNNRPAVRVGDLHACSKHGPGPVTTGASQVWIGGRPMARDGDLCLCAGAGSGSSEVGGRAGPYEGSASWDPEKLEARAKAKGDAMTVGGSAADGLVKGKVDVLGGEVDGGVGPSGFSGKGEIYGAKAEGQVGDEDNNVGLSTKFGSAEAEGDSWVGQQDGKVGFSQKSKKGADLVTLKGRSKQTERLGDYSLETESEAEVSFLGTDGDPPVGIWGHVDTEKGEICIGGYGQTPKLFGFELEMMKQYKFRWKPSGGGGGGGSGGPPNLIAKGSGDVFLG